MRRDEGRQHRAGRIPADARGLSRCSPARRAPLAGLPPRVPRARRRGACTCGHASAPPNSLSAVRVRGRRAVVKDIGVRPPNDGQARGRGSRAPTTARRRYPSGGARRASVCGTARGREIITRIWRSSNSYLGVNLSIFWSILRGNGSYTPYPDLESYKSIQKDYIRNNNKSFRETEGGKKIWFHLSVLRLSGCILAATGGAHHA